MNKIAYKINGKLEIVTAAPKEQLEVVLGKLTDEEYSDHVYARSIPADATEVTEVTKDISDRYFREAWDLVEGVVAVDMPRARDIQMNKIRNARDKKLQELDIETMRGNDVQSEKQVLRDLPDNIDLTTANTPEELKVIWPEALE